MNEYKYNRAELIVYTSIEQKRDGFKPIPKQFLRVFQCPPNMNH
jgi:hypothetical protein